ncbi:nicotinate-nucleotide adenylyltransferase [Dissulfurirhabdus thermomarina]|uniref:Nicotinate-nucleotide adenylyltransferase n=1 Tax=Dissulfurirhabdus thermomarina TaxID=1765737 RepID=A0A6N9TQB1_DISTH|nr:nicotinate-nucleotide adenylyltransferase [Dissulfurirhabdus thermomarina]NDY41627.1 nicotinate-nucleotide adenylyltransferase [Dissulfurirhabdus thermomarina]NMX23330.1 nicotinate-nucleotide adenylyltransferase [Dissulfurirhabdus thermomarina]
MTTGVIHGRFQVFHNDHLAYLLAGRDRCDHLVVGITNPDPWSTRRDPADPARSDPAANPLTYYERHRILQAVLLDEGLDPAAFSIVPFPVNFPERWAAYVPLDAVFFLTIYDAWGERKLRLFQDRGLRAEVLWRRPPARKGLSASRVRALIREGGDWEPLVPPAAARVMKALGIPERLRGGVDTHSAPTL